MSNDTELPADVVQAILANRKIEAIKRLREHKGLGLKEAKHAVDAYARDNQHLIDTSQQSGGGGRIVIVVIALLLTYFLYQQFAQ